MPVVCQQDNYQITPPSGWSVTDCGHGAWAKAGKDRAEVRVVAEPVGLFDNYADYTLQQFGKHASHTIRGTRHLAGAPWKTIRTQLDAPWNAVLYLATTTHKGVVYTLFSDVQVIGNPDASKQATQADAAIESFRFIH